MSKYINADKLKSFIDAGKHRNPCEKVFSENDIIDMVNQMPPADVVEVKHGEWIKNDNGTYSCSLCQSWIPKEQYYYARYCLHCGADMRGETE